MKIPYHPSILFAPEEAHVIQGFSSNDGVSDGQCVCAGEGD